MNTLAIVDAKPRKTRFSSWGRSAVRTVRLALACAALLAAALPVPAAAASLAADHPEAAIFRQMARRGGIDFAVRQGRLPASLADIQDAGYSAYLFPTNWRPDFRFNGRTLTISSFGRPVYLAGEYIQGYDSLVVLPEPGLYEDVQTIEPVAGMPAEQRATVTERHWRFPGAQWLYAGYGWHDVERALRAERISIHLNFLTSEFQSSLSRMPQTLTELERFGGTERNYLGWQGVQEVATLDSVEWQAGNLFVGWDRNDWVISINLGPQTETRRWSPTGRGGIYSSRQAIGY